MTSPIKWTTERLRNDAAKATAIFRRERLDEPLELYSRFFREFVPIFRSIIDKLPDLYGDHFSQDALAAMVGDAAQRTAFRYLAAPPISEDDLKTLADTTLSASNLRRNREQAQRVRETVLHIIDPHRFPWVIESRRPRGDERDRAVIASAALVATRKVETSRRKNVKDAQELCVKDTLRRAKFAEVEPRDIQLLDQAPDPGQFCGESKLGETRADIIVRLYDRRVMPIECKVSNSAVNSFKRLNHEAVGKSTKWLKAYGERATVPSAILGGVFNPNNLETAQQAGLSLFWAFRLKDLTNFIASTRGRRPPLGRGRKPRHR